MFEKQPHFILKNIEEMHRCQWLLPVRRVRHQYDKCREFETESQQLFENE